MAYYPEYAATYGSPTTQYSPSYAMYHNGSQQSNSSTSSYASAYVDPNEIHYVPEPSASYTTQATTHSRSSSGNSSSATKSTKTEKSYPCLYPGCPSAAKGAKFTRPADLSRHQITQHFRESALIDCTFAWCERQGDHGFTRKDHLNEHLRQVHMVGRGRQAPR